MNVNAPFPFLTVPGLALLLGLLLPQAAPAQNVITEMGPIPPKTHAPVTIVEQRAVALRTDGSTQPARIYTVQAGEPPPMVTQQKQTTSITTIETKPKKRVETVSVKKETHRTKPRHPAHSKKKPPVLAKASKETSKPRKHVVVEHTETTKRPAHTLVTREKTVTTVRPPASDATWVNSGTINALVTSPEGAPPHWSKSHVMTISAELPKPTLWMERETTEVHPDVPELGASDTQREEVIDARLLPPAPKEDFSLPVHNPAVPVANPSDKLGFVKSPFPPHDDLDVRGLSHGTLARDPLTGRQFRVP
jgi:hypothetical protein